MNVNSIKKSSKIILFSIFFISSLTDCQFFENQIGRLYRRLPWQSTTWQLRNSFLDVSYGIRRINCFSKKFS